MILTTSGIAAKAYSLTVQNVEDLAGSSGPFTATSFLFQGIALSTDVVGSYSLDTMVIVDTDTLVYDATSNGNNGKAKNSPSLVPGVFGNAMQFDGVDDWVSYEPSESFDIGTDAISVSLWTKMNFLPTELPAAHGPMWDSETDQYVIYEDKANAELRFKVATQDALAERPGIPEADLVTNQWLHIAGVYDGANVMIYLNGQLKDTHVLTGLITPGQAVTLGRNSSSNAFFSGALDQIKIYNRALSENEVLEEYNLKSLPVEQAVSNRSITADRAFSVYPNPNRGNFQLNTATAETVLKIEISDLSGKTVYSSAPFSGGKISVNMDSPVAGMYIIKLKTSGGVYTQRLLIK